MTPDPGFADVFTLFQVILGGNMFLATTRLGFTVEIGKDAGL